MLMFSALKWEVGLWVFIMLHFNFRVWYIHSLNAMKRT